MSDKSMKVATFRVHGHYLGLAVNKVQEILRPHVLTRVPLSHAAVAGLLNLRGKILTAIDVREHLKFPPREPGHEALQIVANTDEETVSFLVDEIGDVIDAPFDRSEDFPDTISGALRKMSWRIFKLDGKIWTEPNKSSRLKQISAGSDGTIWGVNDGGKLFKRD